MPPPKAELPDNSAHDPARDTRVELRGRVKRATYRRVTVYMTHEQHRWLSKVAGEAADDGVPISASDVARLAVDALRRRPGNLRQRVIEHARAEVVAYPGRAKRGLPVSQATATRPGGSA